MPRANLTDAFSEIGPRFSNKTGIRVVFSFGATAELAKQIEKWCLREKSVFGFLSIRATVVFVQPKITK